MEYITLGSSRLTVSRLGFGCEPLGGTDWGRVETEDVIRAVRRAYDAGVTLFDTADVYGLGRSEELLALALGPRRTEVIVATKFGVGWEPDPLNRRARTFKDASARAVVRCVDASLRRLGLEQIPLYQLHWPDRTTPVAETMGALARCVEAGKIRCVGACNVSAADVREMHAVLPLTSVQMPFSLLDVSTASETLSFCIEQGIGTLAYGCLAQGLLTGKYRETDEFGPGDRRSRLPHFRREAYAGHAPMMRALADTARACGRTPAQTAIRWVLENGVDVAIVGAKRVQQLEENLGAVGWALAQGQGGCLHVSPMVGMPVRRSMEGAVR